MQPYFFPYIGYWQLLNLVDRYIILDDVTYIKQGYINRNYILAKDKTQQINIQINGISSNKLISELELNGKNLWKKKVLKNIQQNYNKAPQFVSVFPLIQKCILFDEPNLASYLTFQIKEVVHFLKINTEIVTSSSLGIDRELKGQNRILSICEQQSAKTYINAVGGQELYSKTVFKQNNIKLEFIKMNNVEYSQFSNNFVPFLSIIDVLMFNSQTEIKSMLNKYILI